MNVLSPKCLSEESLGMHVFFGRVLGSILGWFSPWPCGRHGRWKTTDQELVNFFVKGQKVNILGFVGHTISNLTTQLCHCTTIEAICKQMDLVMLQ